MTEFGFPGLQEGDRWCLCLARWKQAYDVGKAPHILFSFNTWSISRIGPIGSSSGFCRRC